MALCEMPLVGMPSGIATALKWRLKTLINKLNLLISE